MDEQQEVIQTRTQEIDTNAEYISTTGIYSQPPIITSVFKAIFVEMPWNFLRGIINFFKWWRNLFRDAFRYLRYPSLKLDPFATKDYKASCQHTFEFLLFVIGVVIFLIKLNWISQPERPEMLAAYNNDIDQAGFQFFMFLFFGISYFLLAILTKFLNPFCFAVSTLFNKTKRPAQ